MRTLGYTRASAGSQYARPQLDALIAAGVESQDVFSDLTCGANGAPDRPGIRRLLECAEAGDTVVLWRIDRLGRSLIEVLDTVTMLVERGISLRSVQDGIDPTTASGRLMLDLLVRLADYEWCFTGERIAAGMDSARQAGAKIGRPPVDPQVTADKLRTVQESRARGLTAAEAAQLVGWSRATFYRHLHEHESQP